MIGSKRYQSKAFDQAVAVFVFFSFVLIMLSRCNIDRGNVGQISVCVKFVALVMRFC